MNKGEPSVECRQESVDGDVPTYLGATAWKPERCRRDPNGLGTQFSVQKTSYTRELPEKIATWERVHSDERFLSIFSESKAMHSLFSRAAS